MTTVKPVLVTIIALSLTSNLVLSLSFILTKSQVRSIEKGIDHLTLWLEEHYKFRYLLNKCVDNFYNGKLLLPTWLFLILPSTVSGYYLIENIKLDNHRAVIILFLLTYLSIIPLAGLNLKLMEYCRSQDTVKRLTATLFILPFHIIVQVFVLYCPIYFRQELMEFFNTQNFVVSIVFYILSLALALIAVIIMIGIMISIAFFILGLVYIFALLISMILWRITMYDGGYIKGIVLITSLFLTAGLTVLIYLSGYY